MAEEKEAPTAPGALACFKNHVAVVLGTQTLMQDIKALEVVFERIHERLHSIVGHLDTRSDDQSVRLALVRRFLTSSMARFH